MEVILPEESSNFVKKPIPISYSNHTTTDNQVLVEKELEKCKHFTIRDYVSEVRKRDTQICFPFALHKHSSDEHSNFLQPLAVRRFRQWCCESCLQETISSTSIETEAMENNQTIRISDASIPSASAANNSIAKFQQQSEQNDNPTPLNGKNGHASPLSVLNNEGNGVSRVVHSVSEDSQNRICKSNILAADEETCKTKVKISRIALLSDDTPKNLSSNRERTVIDNPAIAVSINKQDQEVSKIRKRKALDECNEEESDTSIRLSVVRKLGIFEEKSHPKNALKFRSMDDIMKSTAPCKDEKNYISAENTGVSRKGTIGPLNTSKINEGNPYHKTLPIQNEENNIKDIPNKGERSGLIRWVKKEPKKPRLHKEINTSAENPIRREKNCKIVEDKKKSNVMPEFSFMPQKDRIAQKGCIITEVPIKKSHPKSIRNIICRKKLHYPKGIQYKTNKNALSSDKKKKRPVFEHGSSSQIRHTKDTTIRVSKQVTANDIPMDIVELLATKQQEKLLMNSQNNSENKSKVPESIESLKDDNSSASKNVDTQHSCSEGKKYLRFDLNQEAPACASTELQSPSPYIGLSINGAHLSIIDMNKCHSPQNVCANGTILPPNHSDPALKRYFSDPINSLCNNYNRLLGLCNGYPSETSGPKICSEINPEKPGVNLKPVANNAGNVFDSIKETISASNLLKIMQQSIHSGEPSHSTIQNDYLWSLNLGYEVKNKQGGNLCKPLPRFGVLGPQLQKEITNSYLNITPSLGFGARNFNKSSFIANESTFNKSTNENVISAQMSKTIDYSNAHIASASRAFQPVKTTCKMEECVLNRNPAEDCQYVLDFPDIKPQEIPQNYVHGQKGKKTRKLSDLRRSQMSKPPSSRGRVRIINLQ